MKQSLILSIVVSGMLVISLMPRTETVRYDVAVFAGIQTSSLEALPSGEMIRGGESEAEAPLNPPKVADNLGGRPELPWLHVEVETKYAWIYQKSVARAWTTVSRDDTTRVKVGKLCLRLEAHLLHEWCGADTSYVELADMKRRVAVKKKKAVVTAWAENPALEKVTVEMMP